MAVRVDARVVLREGPLELFACSPQTKEHESVVSVLARPMHIFQAMGLIGLEPGSPPRYDEKQDQWHHAHGEPLDLRVEWRPDDKLRTARPVEWMIEKKTGRPPGSLDWVFSGSVQRQSAASELSREAGADEPRFAADSEGTVVCVVDFESALISLSTRYSADDAELWLSANPQAIPSPGTRCTLVIRSAHYPKIEAEIATGGRLLVDGNETAVARIAERLTRDYDGRVPRLTLIVDKSAEGDATKNAIRAVEEEMRRRNLDPAKSLVVRTKAPVKEPGPKLPASE